MNIHKVETPIPRQSEDQSTGSVQRPSYLDNVQSVTIGLLSRGLRWIQASSVGRKSTRRLHVSATVPLGEKRFVSIIECDGLQFLIAGGATNVSLLAQLPSQLDANADNSDTIPLGRVR